MLIVVVWFPCRKGSVYLTEPDRAGPLHPAREMTQFVFIYICTPIHLASVYFTPAFLPPRHWSQWEGYAQKCVPYQLCFLQFIS